MWAVVTCGLRAYESSCAHRPSNQLLKFFMWMDKNDIWRHTNKKNSLRRQYRIRFVFEWEVIIYNISVLKLKFKEVKR